MTDNRSILVDVAHNAVVCYSDTAGTPAELSDKWIHPRVDIYVRNNGVNMARAHERVSHAIQTALQDMRERVSTLRYLRHGGGVHPDRRVGDHEDTRMALFGERDDN